MDAWHVSACGGPAPKAGSVIRGQYSPPGSVQPRSPRGQGSRESPLEHQRCPWRGWGSSGKNVPSLCSLQSARAGLIPALCLRLYPGRREAGLLGAGDEGRMEDVGFDRRPGASLPLQADNLKSHLPCSLAKSHAWPILGLSLPEQFLLLSCELEGTARRSLPFCPSASLH